MNSQNLSLTINISNTSKFKSGHVMLNFGRFIFKKMRVSTCSSDKHALCEVTTSPAVENTLSLAREVACTTRYFLATFDKRGNLFSFTFHHKSGSESSSIFGSVLYNLFQSQHAQIMIYQVQLL